VYQAATHPLAITGSYRNMAANMPGRLSSAASASVPPSECPKQVMSLSPAQLATAALAGIALRWFSDTHLTGQQKLLHQEAP